MGEKKSLGSKAATGVSKWRTGQVALGPSLAASAGEHFLAACSLPGRSREKSMGKTSGVAFLLRCRYEGAAGRDGQYQRFSR